MSNTEQPEFEHIAQVISAVMRDSGRSVKADGKSNRGKYPTIDATLIHLREHMANRGLSYSMDEYDKPDILPQPKGKPLVFCHFAFWLSWKDQHTTIERESQNGILEDDRTIGKIRSYALKNWLRAKFMLANGEKDFDEEDTSYSHDIQVGPAPAYQHNGGQSPYGNQYGPPPQQHGPPPPQQAPPPVYSQSEVKHLLQSIGLFNNQLRAVQWITNNPDLKSYAELDEYGYRTLKRFIKLVSPADANWVPTEGESAMMNGVPVHDFLVACNLVDPPQPEPTPAQ